MTTSVVKPSKLLRGSFSAVAHLQDAQNRAWELYQAAIKREEANYVERMQRAMEQYAGVVGVATPPPPPTNEGPPAEQAA